MDTLRFMPLSSLSPPGRFISADMLRLTSFETAIEMMMSPRISTAKPGAGADRVIGSHFAELFSCIAPFAPPANNSKPMVWRRAPCSFRSAQRCVSICSKVIDRTTMTIAPFNLDTIIIQQCRYCTGTGNVTTASCAGRKVRARR